jgi:hypothetical protein
VVWADEDGWIRCRACGAKLARRQANGLTESRHRHWGAAGIFVAQTGDCGREESGWVHPAAEVLMVALWRVRNEAALT